MIFEKLSALIAEQFNVDPDTITMDTSFEDDLNADSVDIVDLSMALEEEFGIEELGEAEATSITTVGDLVRHKIQSSAEEAELCLSGTKTGAGQPRAPGGDTGT